MPAKTSSSAFTYLDEEQPSRLDFGKDEKLGGHFTEEEVEDVKTVLRLVAVLFSLVYFSFKNKTDS